MVNPESQTFELPCLLIIINKLKLQSVTFGALVYDSATSYFSVYVWRITQAILLRYTNQSKKKIYIYIYKTLIISVP